MAIRSTWPWPIQTCCHRGPTGSYDGQWVIRCGQCISRDMQAKQSVIAMKSLCDRSSTWLCVTRLACLCSLCKMCSYSSPTSVYMTLVSDVYVYYSCVYGLKTIRPFRNSSESISANQSISVSVSQSFSQSINSINQSISWSINHSFSQPNNRSTNSSIYQSITQSIT